MEVADRYCNYEQHKIVSVRLLNGKTKRVRLSTCVMIIGNQSILFERGNDSRKKL